MGWLFRDKEKPNILNPYEGFFATANSNLTSREFPYKNAIGWEWSDPSRWARVNELLGANNKITMQDMAKIQTDYLSNPARTIVPLLKYLKSNDSKAEKARQCF